MIIIIIYYYYYCYYFYHYYFTFLHDVLMSLQWSSSESIPKGPYMCTLDVVFLASYFHLLLCLVISGLGLEKHGKQDHKENEEYLKWYVGSSIAFYPFFQKSKSNKSNQPTAGLLKTGSIFTNFILFSVPTFSSLFA